ncbi:MAG: DUF2442 domain-containing protein [Chitinispirillaceae bacterium]|nr:DUF2442 domain-containing protein [Chitinispirillaceae bacterium]
MEKIPRITDVKPLPEKHLEILFENGIRKDYNCNQVIKRPEFFLLSDEGFFRSAKVDTGGYGISWNDDVDISEYEAWVNGTLIES